MKNLVEEELLEDSLVLASVPELVILGRLVPPLALLAGLDTGLLHPRSLLIPGGRTVLGVLGELWLIRWLCFHHLFIPPTGRQGQGG